VKDLLFDRPRFGDFAYYLLLACGDLVNISRHLLPASCELVDVMRHLLLAGGKFVDVLRYLFLSGGDAVDALPHRLELKRHCVEPLLIGRRDSWRCQSSRIRCLMRNCRKPRCQPVKLRV